MRPDPDTPSSPVDGAADGTGPDAPPAGSDAGGAGLPLARSGARPLEIEPRAGRKTTWVLVADEAIARILQWPEYGDELDSVEELTDPAAHAREGDFQRDATGRRAGSASQGSRQNTTQHRLRGTASVTASAGEDQQHQEAQSFARRVAQHLAEALRQRRFEELRIVAAPRFLGALRKELDAHVRAVVVEEVDKDVIHESNADITRRLFPRAGREA